MPNIPFLNPSVLKQLDLPVPSRDTTPQVLEPLNLNRPYAPTVDIQAYRQLYGFDSLECEHWQGYVQMPLFKLHVQVFQPKLEAGKLEKSKGTVFLLHGYLEHSGIYQPIVKEILEQGFSVLTYDLPGHGLSNGSPASIQNFDHYQQVLHAIYQYVRNADQLPKPWLGVGQVPVVRSGCIIYWNLPSAGRIRLSSGCCYYHLSSVRPKVPGGIIRWASELSAGLNAKCRAILDAITITRNFCVLCA